MADAVPDADAGPRGAPSPGVRPRRGELLLVLAYAGLLIVLLARHEIWRDEARAIHIVAESASIRELFRHLHNEGHPGLWYLILYFAYSVAHTNAVLKIANAAVVIASAWVFATRSPFTLLERALFLFGYFPLYEYGVKSRNYGIGMLLIFVCCALYPARRKRFLLLSGALALLAQTSAPGLIVSASIAACLLVQILLFEPQPLTGRGGTILGGFAIIGLGALASAVQMIPDSSSFVTDLPGRSLWDVAAALPPAILAQGAFAAQAFRAGGHFHVAWLLLIVYVYLLRKPSLVVMLLSSVVGLQLLNDLVTPTSLRHQGFLILALIAVLWMDASTNDEVNPRIGEIHQFVAFTRQAGAWLLPIFLVTQVAKTVPPAWDDYRGEFSSSLRAARYVRGRPDLRDAILLAEPDFPLESLGYYLDNPVYIVREKRYGRVISLTRANKSEISLGELLSTAEEVRRASRRPVLIFLKFDLVPDTRIHYSTVKTFLVLQKDLVAFRRRTELLRIFNGARMTDENFDLYLLPYPAGDRR